MVYVNEEFCNETLENTKRNSGKIMAEGAQKVNRV